MASTYSDLKIELIGTGDQTGTWGTTTNNNFSVAISEAITGSADVAYSSAADVTVTLTDVNSAQTARNLRLNITESGAGIGYTGNLILGSGCQIEKLYLVNNTTTATKTIKNTSGTGIAVPAGKSMFVYNNGTNVVDATTHLSSLTLGAALPVASGGTGTTSTTFTNLATNVTGTLPVANGGTSLATLTANNVILGNGTSAPSFVAPSTNGNVLTSNGTTWTSAAAASGSPMVFLATTTTSTSVSSVDFSGLDGSTYIAFMVQIQGVRPAGDNGQLRMQLRNSSGTITASSYSSGLNTSRSDSGYAFLGAGTVDYFNLTSANVRSSTAGGCQGVIFISQSANATPSFTSAISWWAPPDGVAFISQSGGALQSAYSGTVITGFNFLYASGNITSSSKFTVYGLKAS